MLSTGSPCAFKRCKAFLTVLKRFIGGFVEDVEQHGDACGYRNVRETFHERETIFGIDNGAQTLHHRDSDLWLRFLGHVPGQRQGQQEI